MATVRYQTERGDFRATQKQIEYFNLRAKYNLFSGGVRNGKTLSCAICCINNMLWYRGNKAVVTRKTYPELRDAVIPVYEMALRDIPHSFNASELTIQFSNGSKILFRSTEDSAHVRKLHGLTLGVAVMDEAVDQQEEAFNILQDRLSMPGVPHFMYLATNPGSRNSWVYKRLIDAQSPEYMPRAAVVHATTFDNEGNLPADYVADRREMEKINPSTYRRMILGVWGDIEGLVYSIFDPLIHLAEPPETCTNYYIGIDWGAFHAFVALLIGTDYDGNMYVCDEFYFKSDQSRSELWLAGIKKMLEGRERAFMFAVADPSGKAFINDFSANGLTIIKGNNDVEGGISSVNNALGRAKAKRDGLIAAPGLYISPKCKNLIREMQAYTRDKTTGKVDKINDDAVDALRYIVHYLSIIGNTRFIGRPS